MSRKIIQIATAMTYIPQDNSSVGLSSFTHSTLALCDDGSVWEYSEECGDDQRSTFAWEKLPDIPKENQEISINNLK